MWQILTESGGTVSIAKRGGVAGPYLVSLSFVCICLKVNSFYLVILILFSQYLKCKGIFPASWIIVNLKKNAIKHILVSILIHVYIEKSENTERSNTPFKASYTEAVTVDILWLFLPIFFPMNINIYLQYFDISYSFNFSFYQVLVTSFD